MHGSSRNKTSSILMPLLGAAMLIFGGCSAPPSNSEMIDRFETYRDSLDQLAGLYPEPDSLGKASHLNTDSRGHLMKRLGVLNIHRETDGVYFVCTGNVSGIEKGYILVDPNDRTRFPPHDAIVDSIDDSQLTFAQTAYQSLDDGWYLYCILKDSD